VQRTLDWMAKTKGHLINVLFIFSVEKLEKCKESARTTSQEDWFDFFHDNEEELPKNILL